MEEGQHALRVLAVDDNDAIRRLMADVLSEASCHVFTASDGAEAVEILEAEPVDLLLTDYDMPRMNGLELIRWSRTHLPHVATVMITGAEREAVAPEAWKSGAHRILLKPFSSEHLLLVVGDLLGATASAWPTPQKAAEEKAAPDH